MNVIFKDKRIVFVISLLLSFLLWLTVSLVIRPTGEIVVPGVGVNVNVQSGLLSELGLSAIEGDENVVNVTISGSRSVIGGVLPEDISISPSLSGVSGAGSYELELKAVNNSSKEFEIVSVSPSKISVKFDKYIDKVVPLKYNITGDYNIPDEFIQEEIYTNPSKIIVTGPEIDLEKIEYALVEIVLSGDYSETIAASGEVFLVDKEGNSVDYNKAEITLDNEKATVYIPVYKISNLPFTFDYTNVPEYFDLSNINYTISPANILVEGEDSIIDRYSDIFLGYVDIRALNTENSSVKFDVALPEGLTAQDSVNDVYIDFDFTDYVENTFNATQINIINVPKEYKVTSNTSKVAVTLMGPEEVINSISAKDIVVQLDLSTREITQTGQYRIQADVFLPGGENAWAIGTYSITVTVKEQ